MPATRIAKFAAISAMALAFIAVAFFLFGKSHDRPAARKQLLEFIPADANTVIYVDLADLKESPFLANLYAWAPNATQDSDYSQFVRDTSFAYERDLARAIIAVSSRGDKNKFLVVADAKFDHSKIDSYLQRNAKVAQQGKLKTYLLNSTVSGEPLCVAFFSDTRIAITNSENLSSEIAAAGANLNRKEWNSRFERLAGTPLFAVIRQDGSRQPGLGSVPLGGYNSPQLSVLLGQLPWISIAGKPEGDQLRIVAEGESVSDSASSQLRDFLQGLLLLAQNGLNDPKLRQQMKPQDRQTYLELLKSADIQKIDRGDWKSVRAVFTVTPDFLELARQASLTPQPAQSAAPQSSAMPAPQGSSKAHKK
jgi:hypothetical protein